MKGKKLLSCLLALALCLPVLARPAMAVSFPDVPAGHWAEKFVDDTVKKGIFEGYNATTFAPEDKINMASVLATCARVTVDKDTRTIIGTKRADQIKGILGSELTWFHKEAATCIEAGILSAAELKELQQTKALNQPATREDIAFYLVRAMQLEPMAKSLPAYTLGFTDKKTITPGREPYIYILNMYGIINGFPEDNTFRPKGLVTRAQAAAMLSRATDFMKESGTKVELPEYEAYASWESGVILTAAGGGQGVVLLTLETPFSGAKTITLPADIPVYENSMLLKKDQFKPGVYARINLDAAGKAISVRLSGSVQTFAGSVVGLSEDAVMLSANGATRTLEYDRFAQVQVGGKVGGRSLIDLDAGYAAATCQVDQLGHMVSLSLTGGTHKEEGILKSVVGTTLTVAGLDGQTRKYELPAGVKVTINGLASSVTTISRGMEGYYVSLRVLDENAGSATAVAMDTVTRYVQGAVKATGSEAGINTVTLTDLATGKADTYKVAPNATFFDRGKAITHGGIQKDWFATVRLSGGDLEALWGYPGSSTTEGTLTTVNFPAGVPARQVLTVTLADGSVAGFSFELAGNLPEVKRAGKTANLADLRTGDAIKVTTRYNAITLIEATPRKANLTGTITEITQTIAGVTIKVELDDGAGVKTYTVGDGVSVTQEGKIIPMYELRVGYRVAMVSDGDQLSSISVEKAPVNANQVNGTVILVNTTDKTILFRRAGSAAAEQPITVLVPYGTPIQDVLGNPVALGKLATDDTLDIYGAYVNNQFKATLVIKR